MPSDSVRLALVDIRDCILSAHDFTQGLSYEAFKQSRLHFFAVARALEIISEASRRLPRELRDRHPKLPWREIRDAGNMYRHSYDNVAESIVWKTLQDDLAPLLAVVLAEIEALPNE